MKSEVKTSGHQKRILFVHNGRTRFVQIDLDLLRPHFDVTELYLPSPRFNPARVVQLVRQHDLVLGWFASWHTWLPMVTARRLGKPAILIVGGYDTASVPEANYGAQRGGIRRLIARQTIYNATHLITNSHSARDETICNVGVSAEKITVIYHGVPAIPAGNMTHRDPIVLTVGNVWQENLLRKGLLPFVQSAKLLPDLQFVLVGKWYDDSIDTLRSHASPNVTFTGFVDDDELTRLYQTASVYVQASLHEGFGMSVAEAMLGGCIPVVTEFGSLPEVVKNHGKIIPDQKPEIITSAIDVAMNTSSVKRQAARDHILTTFPLERRAQLLRTFLAQWQQ